MTQPDYIASITLYQAVKRHCPHGLVTHHDYGPTSFAIWVNGKSAPPYEMPFLLSLEAPEDEPEGLWIAVATLPDDPMPKKTKIKRAAAREERA